MSQTDESKAKFDKELPKHYKELLFRHARAFNADAPDNDNAHLDGDPTWDFHVRSNGQFDAAESIFVARQLEYLRPGVYAKKYPQLKWQQFVPANYNVDTGAEQYTVQGSDYAGQVAIAKLPSNNVPMVSMKVFEGSMGFFSMQLGYQYNLQEARNAIFARRPLSPALAMGCRNIMERKLDDIAFLGEKTTGTRGLFTLAGTDIYVTPTTGAGGSTSWDTKSPTAILLDLNGPIDQVIIKTNEVEIPNAMILPTSRKRIISTLKVGDGTDTTVLAFFLKNQEFISEIGTTYKSENFDGSAPWVGKRAIAYVKDDEHLEMVIPQRFEQFQPVVEGVTITTQCHLRTGGIGCMIPQSVVYWDGI